MDSGIMSGADLRGNCTNNNCHIGDGMNLLINRQLWPYKHYDASREFEARYADDYGIPQRVCRANISSRYCEMPDNEARSVSGQCATEAGGLGEPPAE